MRLLCRGKVCKVSSAVENEKVSRSKDTFFVPNNSAISPIGKQIPIYDLAFPLILSETRSIFSTAALFAGVDKSFWLFFSDNTGIISFGTHITAIAYVSLKLLFHNHRTNRMSRNALAPSRKAQLFFGSRLDGYHGDIHLANLCDIASHIFDKG